MIHYVYKITNLINNRYYIGKHSSRDFKTDNYFGSGKVIKLAIEKYGKQNFKREILFQFNEQSLAFIKQKQVLSQQVLSDPLCYNISTGGHGSFSHRKGCTCIKNKDGRLCSISCSEYNRDIHLHPNKNMLVMFDKTTGTIKRISKLERLMQPQRYSSINKHYAVYRNKSTGQIERLNNQEQIDKNKYEHINSGFLTVRVTDHLQRISVNDSRYTSGQLKSKEFNMVHCYDSAGNFYILDKESPQWKSGKYKGLNANKIWCYDPTTLHTLLVTNPNDIPIGYKVGRGKQYNTKHKGNKFMSKDGIIKSVPPNQVQSYMQNGWIHGFKHKTKNSCKRNN